MAFVKYLLPIFFLVCCAGQDVFSQQEISGVVNQYGRIDSVFNLNNANRDSVIVPGAKDIWTGADDFEIAMFVQVKGVGIYDPSNSPFQGFWGTEYNIYNTGIYSFMLVDRVVGDSLVIFSSSLREDMGEQTDTVPATAQLVKVPYGRSFRLNGDLQAEPWDPVTKTGGVLALFASDKLDLAGFNIDVMAKGFFGGDTLRDDYGAVSCAFPAKDTTYYLDADNHLAGKKGESIVFSGYKFTRGNGFVAGGGGGGEGRFSGGAGGSNWGKGAKGGYEAENFCSPTRNYGGWGGTLGTDKMPADENRIYLGSGGGSSVPESGLTAIPGGNGGGIVIIITDTLAGSVAGDSIFAAGESVMDVSNTGGGGGGAGGFILLDVNNTEGNVLLDVSGGNGGDTYDEDQLHGPGGGGGGGIIWHSGPVLLDGLSENKSAGTSGKHLPDVVSNGAGDGGAAKTETDLILPLRGFFFNFISGDQDVCQDTIPGVIIGSWPKGDTGFVYVWQDSTFGVLPQNMAGDTTKDYAPGTLTETKWFRRIVTQKSDPFETDTSNWIEKTFFNKIQNNLVAPDDTVCYDVAPDPMFYVGGGLTGGDGTYSYQWWARTDNDSQWKHADSLAVDGIDTGEGFNPDKLYDTTYFARQVISHVCQHISDSLRVIVFPLIDNNEIDGEDTVCQYTNANEITGLVPTGGDIGNYEYIWQASSDKSGWDTIATGIVNYSPGSMDTVTTYYRRLVYSGKDNTCSDISPSVTIKVDPQILQNSIAPDTAICAETPTNLIYPDASIIGGDGIYKYTFFESTDSSVWTIARTESLVDTYNPVELSQTTWFFRSVVSGACFDTSNSIRFYTDTTIFNNKLFTPDDTICQGTNSRGILGSVAKGGDRTSWTYLWDKSADLVDWTNGFETGQNLDPQFLYDTSWYRRRVLSGVCFDTSFIVVVNVHDTITGNRIWTDTVQKKDVCVLLPKLIRGQDENDGLSGGTGTAADFNYLWQKYDPSGSLWNDAPSGGKHSNDQNNYETGVLTGSEYRYRRFVSSGKCSHTSDSCVLIVKPRPMGSITATATDSVCFDGENQIRIVVPVTFSEGLKPFTLYYNDGQGGTGMEILDTYGGDFSIFRETSDSTLYTVMIDSITDAYGCVDTMILENKGIKQGMLYLNQSPVTIQDTFRVCGDETTIAVTEGLGWKRGWGPESSDYTITPKDNPQAVFKLTGWGNDTLFYPLTWYQKNGVCDQNSVTVTVKLYQPPLPARVMSPDSLVYFRQLMPLWADTVEIGLGTWSWVEDNAWIISGGGAPIKDIHNNGAIIDLGGDDLDKEVFRELVWRVRNGECPGDSVKVEITRRDLILYTAFSPNGDVFNEFLILDGLEFADEFTMQIFSRHMILVKTVTEADVFVDPRSGEKNAVWDGRMEDGSEAKDGTYFYMIEVIHGGQKYTYKNFLELIRTDPMQ